MDSAKSAAAFLAAQVDTSLTWEHVRRLRDLGVSKDQLPKLAANALADPCMATNPMVMSKQEIEAIYEEVL